MLRRPAVGLVLALAGCGATAAPVETPTAQSQPAPPPPSAVPPAPPPSAVPPPSASAAAPPQAPPPEPPAPEGMLAVPGGSFVMGADDEGEQDERPAHSVTVAAFWLDRTEVTNAAYLECVKAGVCRMYREDVAQSMKAGPERKFRGPTQPVVGVSWQDAKTYCEWRGKRLPTEAEWERAARDGDGRRFPWGNDRPVPGHHGCFQGVADGATAPVGSYPDGAGPYGHLDLAGNVWEWLADAYDPYAYRRPTADRGIPGSCEEILATQNELRQQQQQGFTGTNPIPTVCERVLRGGAFNYHVPGLRSSNRVHHPGTWRILVAGIRCAQDS
jgi:formylglycine-generating enzyme required for sulfatase activity